MINSNICSPMRFIDLPSSRRSRSKAAEAIWISEEQMGVSIFSFCPKVSRRTRPWGTSSEIYRESTVVGPLARVGIPAYQKNTSLAPRLSSKVLRYLQASTYESRLQPSFSITAIFSSSKASRIRQTPGVKTSWYMQ